jgi:hypothetical protein
MILPMNESRSRGFLMFAYNSSNIDYATMALCNALLIKKHLTVNSVALVTDQPTLDHLKRTADPALISFAFEHVIIDSVDQSTAGQRRFHDTRYTKYVVQYLNLNRPNAYDLSPYDQTLMLDVDYLMLDNSMDLVWDNVEEFMCNHKTKDLDNKVNDFGFDNRFNEMSIPLYWATAVYFTKTDMSRLIFQLMGWIKENYSYYQYLYRFNHSGYFRNDYALSIAIHMTNNLMEYGTIKSLPIDHLLFSVETDEFHKFDNGHCLMTTEAVQGRFHLRRVINNVHIMNKKSILRRTDEIIAYATS